MRGIVEVIKTQGILVVEIRVLYMHKFIYATITFNSLIP